ncbi:MAG: 30S ribosomal protein S7 [Proteobacteria bacterium]|nr:30S ribosomal protein S7 [Pseudomonadota bacterium]
MPRRRVASKREVLPDPKFGSELITKFINVVMYSGKKSIAEKIVYGAFDQFLKRVEQKGQEGGDEGSEGGSRGGRTGTDYNARVIAAFNQALANVKPTVEVRSRRVGGATYQVPVEVRADRSIALGMRWLIRAARARGEKGMVVQLAHELVDAYKGHGSAVKTREDTHKMAKANQAFAHFRWN